ncbi:PH domain-containing protein [Cellulomonas bogoriensis]|uniref:Membrane protein n=1 Tax=Cellulomonas bogoriensis 69B4 = DSM 16987 TaxID=1386082 RepID=A0A0A0BZT9_9CELL|nr:PH domain-containing protein [Cellulomonas bogoriensis]KGM13456.1 membrane protein [Cellulomonas bogoriensis 69B4 = DSM 16987]
MTDPTTDATGTDPTGTDPTGTDRPDVDPADEAVADVPWRRLSPWIVPAALLRMLVRLIPAAAGWWFFNTDDDVARYTVIALAVLAVLNPFNQALNYLKVRFRVVGEELHHTTGLLVRRSTRVALHRIRTVDLTAPLTSRVFGLVTVRVGTGGNTFTGEGAVVLNGMRRGEAMTLRAGLLTHAAPDVAAATAPGLESPTGQVVQALRWRWIVFHMVGASLIAGPLSVVGTVFGLVSLVGRGEWLGEQIATLVDLVPWTAWAVTSAVLVVGVGLATGAVTFTEAWWRYTLVREPSGRFVATRGLLTTRVFTADHDRLRGVTVKQPVLTRALRGARMSPVMTGVSLQQMMADTSTMLPTTTRDVAVRVANTLLGGPVLGEDVTPADGPLRPHPPRARHRAVVRYLVAIAVVAALVAAGALGGWWTWWILAVPLVLVPVGVGAGVGYYRALGHRLDATYLYLRRGYFNRRTDVLQVRGVNGAHVTQSLVQRVLGLANLTVTTAAGDQAYVGVDLAVGDATTLAATLTGERLHLPDA